MLQIAQQSSFSTIETSLKPLLLLTHQILPKTHLSKPIISAKWGKRRSGSQRSNKLIINSIAYIASNFKILPEPLDYLVKEFLVASGGGGGNGGKFWLKKGFGGGGGGRNRRREKLGFWVALLISSGLALWVILEREKESDLLFWVFLVVCAFAVCFILKSWWKREIKDWVLGFSCGAALMGFASRNNENFVRLIHRFRASFPNLLLVSKKRSKVRRWI